MADPPVPEIDDDADVRRGRASTAGTPRWVKVSAVIAFVVVLLVVAMLLVGGGTHGPGRHTPSDDGFDDRTPHATVTASGAADGRRPSAGALSP